MLNETINERGAINLITAAAKLAIRDSREEEYKKESYEFLRSLEGIFFVYDCHYPRNLKKAVANAKRRRLREYD